MNIFSPIFRFRSRQVLVCAALLSATLAVSSVRPARADEFATVAASDPLYRSMSTVARSGWLSKSAASATGGAGALSTRYEMALQTAEAIYAVTARHEADASWDATAPVTSLRALRDLTNSLRPELQKLGVDTNAALRLFGRLISPATASANAESSTRSSALLSTSLSPARSASRLEAASGAGRLSLASRFRIDSAMSALERAAQDPLSNGVSGRVQGAGLAFDVAPGLSLHAGYQNRNLNPETGDLSRLGFQDPSTLGATQERSLKGGLDFSLRSGLLFSTQVEKIGTDGTLASGTRVSGGVGLSAWQNRLSLVAKLSRLKPEDMSSMSASTTAGLNVGVDVSQNMSLNLLYQRLFSAPTLGRSGVLAGGVSIKF